MDDENKSQYSSKVLLRLSITEAGPSGPVKSRVNIAHVGRQSLPHAQEAGAFGGAETLQQFLRRGLDRNGASRGIYGGAGRGVRGTRHWRDRLLPGSDVRQGCVVRRAVDGVYSIIGGSGNVLAERLERNTE